MLIYQIINKQEWDLNFWLLLSKNLQNTESESNTIQIFNKKYDPKTNELWVWWYLQAQSM